MKRPQPYRLAFAPIPTLPPDVNAALARQFQNADQMFDILFRDFGSPGDGPFATPDNVTDAITAFSALVPTLGYWTPLVAGTLPGELIFDGDGDVVMVWVPTP